MCKQGRSSCVPVQMRRESSHTGTLETPGTIDNHRQTQYLPVTGCRRGDVGPLELTLAWVQDSTLQECSRCVYKRCRRGIVGLSHTIIGLSSHLINGWFKHRKDSLIPVVYKTRFMPLVGLAFADREERPGPLTGVQTRNTPSANSPCGQV